MTGAGRSGEGRTGRAAEGGVRWREYGMVGRAVAELSWRLRVRGLAGCRRHGPSWRVRVPG